MATSSPCASTCTLVGSLLPLFVELRKTASEPSLNTILDALIGLAKAFLAK